MADAHEGIGLHDQIFLNSIFFVPAADCVVFENLFLLEIDELARWEEWEGAGK